MEVYEIQSGLGKLPVEWKENISKIEKKTTSRNCRSVHIMLQGKINGKFKIIFFIKYTLANVQLASVTQ